MPRWPILLFVILIATSPLRAAEGNRLSYLDAACDPYYPGREFARLATPQWVGEEGVEAVVVLAIDDMRDTARYEAYLRPILDRLKQIDGRAPVSIMTCRADPADPQLTAWLNEGLSIEVHTFDHPCPLLQGGDFAQAKGTYDRCVDLLHEIPGNRPVAFRMPCCDSRNTPSPRFWTEIFNRQTPAGHFLEMDSSVFNIITPNDPSLPRDVVLDPDGSSRFRKYLPFPSFVNTIEDYPYPYVIGGACWEFPCAVPSDWEAQNLLRPNNPRTVEDLKAALDAVVMKQGTFNLVFHPHGWIRNDQVVELIDHAVARHGRKVKFLTFREALERINAHLLDGQSLRGSEGEDQGVRLLDLNDDGWMDVVWGSDNRRGSRVWLPDEQAWQAFDFPCILNQPEKMAPRFGVVSADGFASLHVGDFMWQFTPTGWKTAGGLVSSDAQARQWSRLLDLDGDGKCERVTAEGVWRWDEENSEQPRLNGKWARTGLTLPEGASATDQTVRFLDVNGDQRLDLLYSGPERYALYFWQDFDQGWRATAVAGRHGEGAAPALPRFYRPDGTNNGVWSHSRHLWIQNEATDRLPDGVDRVSFEELVASAEPEVERDEAGYPPPRSPAAALATMHTTQVEPLVVELVASEPLVTDPVAFDWGPDGRLWVVEMGDYPNGIDWHGEGDPRGTPGGRVSVLSDQNGDGRFDSATVFLDDLPFPTGIKVWRHGALVTAVPEILFAADTDGDGRADQRETLYQGFSEGNQQHRANGLRWGLDNWLHVGNGDSGGTVKSLKSGKSLAISGRDLRIHPDTGDLETEAGQTQFGRNRDDWGNWFGGNNSNPLWHYVLDEHYLRRNPHVAPPDGRQQISVQPGAAPVFPTSLTVARFNDFDRANRFTSACSPMIYRDTLFGATGQTWSFVCEPVHNLVHRELVTREGVSFTSRRPPGEEQSEFLSSTDNWFRPTMVRTGPDGAIWVADMYRLVIEHPKWIPADWQQRLDLRAGADRGRIYRIRPAERPLRAVPRFDRMETEELVAALETENGTRRDLIHQMLVWRNDPRAIPGLRRMATSSSLPQVRAQALCVLDAVGGLDADLLLDASRDAHFGVRRQAVRLAEPFFGESAALVERLLAMTGDEDEQVRLQVAYSLGSLKTEAAGRALATMAGETDDPYLLAALHSSLNAENLSGALAASLSGSTPATAWLHPLLATAGASEQPQETRALLAPLLVEPDAGYQAWQFTTVAILLETFRQHGKHPAEWLDGGRAEQFRQLVAAARELAADAQSAMELRLAAIRLLGHSPDTASRQQLVQLLRPRQGSSIQIAAAFALAASPPPEDETARQLLEAWTAYTPAVRAEILDLLLARPHWCRALLQAIEDGQVQAVHVNAHRRQQLTHHKDQTIRDRAARLLDVTPRTDRETLLRQYSAVATLSGEPSRGKQKFLKHCAACHRWQGIGHAVGPDLAALTDKSVGALLAAVLDPSRAIEDKFLQYAAITRDGRQHLGVIQNESDTSITLAGPEGKSTVVLRSELEALYATGKSMMPEGMEKELAPQDLADLFAYLRSTSATPKPFPGNDPQVAPVRDDGSIRLLAMHARIYGPSLVFEQKYRNLGWWSSPRDHAVWDIQVAEASEYRVTLDYACADSAAGDRFIITVAGQSLAGVVPGTGTWDDYDSLAAGTLSLPAGRHEVTMRSDGLVKTALIDLRSMRLSPR